MRHRKMPFIYRCNLSFPGAGLIAGLVILILLTAVAISWTIVCTVAMAAVCLYLIPVALYERIKSWRGK